MLMLAILSAELGLLPAYGASASEGGALVDVLHRLAYEGVLARDYPLLQGALLLVAVVVVAANAIADGLYALIGPAYAGRTLCRDDGAAIAPRADRWLHAAGIGARRAARAPDRAPRSDGHQRAVVRASFAGAPPRHQRPRPGHLLRVAPRGAQLDADRRCGGNHRRNRRLAVGLGAGLGRPFAEAALMRATDLALAVPLVPLMVVLSAFFGGGTLIQMLVIGGLLWAPPAREVRAQVLSQRERGPVRSAVAMGAGRRHVVRRHLLPALLPLAAGQLVRATATAILLEASLSFLGLGDPAAKSWGTMLHFAQVQGAVLTDAWLWWVIPPGLAIATTVVSLALLATAIDGRRAVPGLVGEARR
jgi:Binding-protein-dependent transport system inner membrane component